MVVLLAFGAALVGCAPEGNRERGGDPGGDIGNWGRPVQMHGEDDPVHQIYYGTPLRGQAIEKAGSAGAVHP
jgi:hypothetical protein